jgi:uroporphyrin-III C-methyltransferase
MGMKKLDEIIDVYSALNKKNTPVAIVQNGSLPDEKLGLGTVSTISDVVKKIGLSSPAIIIIGEIVKHATKNEVLQFTSGYKNN